METVDRFLSWIKLKIKLNLTERKLNEFMAVKTGLHNLYK